MSSPKLVMPKVGSHLILTTPARHVLQMTLNRPKQLNAMTDAMEEDICRVFEWFETEPSLWVIILAGKGRAFCAGQDLKDWLSKNQTSETVRHASGEPMQLDAEVNKSIQRLKRGGFGGMSTRRSAKPIIAAVDGICMGGGTETILNCDMVVASTRSMIGLPEVARGVVAAMGGIPRLTQLCGHVSHISRVRDNMETSVTTKLTSPPFLLSYPCHCLSLHRSFSRALVQQRASELLLLGKPISAKEAHDRYNMVNRLVDVAKSTSDELGQAAVDQAAIEIAIQLTQNSPDSVLVTKSALVMARDATDGDIDASARDNMLSDRSRLLYVGKNINEGLEAFKGVSSHFTAIVHEPARGCNPRDVTDSTEHSLPIGLLSSFCTLFDDRNATLSGSTLCPSRRQSAIQGRNCDRTVSPILDRRCGTFYAQDQEVKDVYFYSMSVLQFSSR